MIHQLDFLRELNIYSVIFRLLLAMVGGGIIGLDREKKRRPAGIRTYMLVCFGAALSVMLSQYEIIMMDTSWSEIARDIGVKVDASRLGAQVINGIGFLGAGTIIVTGRQEVKGLTTAACLWASACMGLAIGAGFYECIFLAFILILFSLGGMPLLESRIIENARHMNLYVEFDSIKDVSAIIGKLKSMGIHIYYVDIDRGEGKKGKDSSAVFNLHLDNKITHTSLIANMQELECISTIYEL